MTSTAISSSRRGLEEAPLLASDSDTEAQSLEENTKAHGKLKPATPLPKKQILVLCIMRFSEPISFNLIFPFINEMIESVGIANPGYSSGLIEGIFALAQLLTVFQWASLSDRIGRKPVLLTGLTGVTIFTCLFGLSTSFPMILFFRFAIGLSNGNVAVLKSAIAELTDETNQGRAFSFLPLSWSVGSIIAPIIGGYLSRPAEQYPDIFGSYKLLVKYPYLLPCLAGASITVMGWLVGFFFFEESLGGRKQSNTNQPPKPSTPHYGSVSTSTRREATEDTLVDPTPPKPVADSKLSFRDIISDSIIQPILLSYIFLALVTVSCDAILVLWLYTPISKGGMGFTASQSGVVLSSIGILATFINLVVFPPLQRRIGTVPIYRVAMMLQAAVVAMFPITRYILLLEGGHNSLVARYSPGLMTKASLGVMVIAKCTGGVVFACNMILVSASAPSRTSLGAVNGVAQMVASSMRALGPTLATIIFALSMDPRYHLLGGQMIWVYMFSLALGGVWASSKVQEGRGEEREA